MEKLTSHPQMVEERKKWETFKNKEKYSGVSSLIRHLTGHIDKKGRSVFTFMGWRVLGIFII